MRVRPMERSAKREEECNPEKEEHFGRDHERGKREEDGCIRVERRKKENGGGKKCSEEKTSAEKKDTLKKEGATERREFSTAQESESPLAPRSPKGEVGCPEHLEDNKHRQ